MKIFLETAGLNILSNDDINYINQNITNAFLTTDKTSGEDAEIVVGFPSSLQGDLKARFPRLRLVQLLSAGYDDFALDALKKSNVRLAIARGSSSATISEHVIGHLLSVNYNLGESLLRQKEKVWKRNYNRIELGGANVLILGTGSIGHEIAKRLKSFNTTIHGFNRSRRIVPYFDHIVATKEELHALYPNIDYLIIALPLNNETYHFVDETSLFLLPPHALLINVGRGKVIDEQALIRALEAKKLRAALLDVMAEEPLPQTSPLWTLPNVFITPHIAFYSNRYAVNLCEIIIQNIKNIQDNKPLLNEVIL